MADMNAITPAAFKSMAACPAVGCHWLLLPGQLLACYKQLHMHGIETAAAGHSRNISKGAQQTNAPVPCLCVSMM
jgi:hypothetical protein